MTARWAWLCAALLAAGVTAEVAWPRDEAADPIVAAPVAALADDQPPGPEPLALWAAAALARPVFTPGRRPDPAGGTPSADAAPGLPRLTGILLTASGRRAIFAAPSGGTRPTVMSEGAAIGAWRIEAIHAGDVLIAGPDGRRTVRVAFSAALPPVLAGMQLPQALQADTRVPAGFPQAVGAAAALQTSPAIRTQQ